jgi:hypothetical protein
LVFSSSTHPLASTFNLSATNEFSRFNCHALVSRRNQMINFYKQVIQRPVYV